MFHFQVFRRAKAKTFPVDGKEIKSIQRERKRKAKEERKKLRVNPQKSPNFGL